jgi:hypothetical protein
MKIDLDDSVRLPEHIFLSIQHNPHRGDYTPIQKWIADYIASAEASGEPADEAILPEDRAEILATGELWVIGWCPSTPVGSREVVAATFARALEIANRRDGGPRTCEGAGTMLTCTANVTEGDLRCAACHCAISRIGPGMVASVRSPWNLSWRARPPTQAMGKVNP